MLFQQKLKKKNNGSFINYNPNVIKLSLVIGGLDLHAFQLEKS